VVSRVAQVLGETHAAEASLAGQPNPALAAAFADMRGQLAALVYPGFVSATGAGRLADLVRYLRAISRRLEKMPESPGRDAERMAAVHRVADDYASVLAELPPSRRQTAGAQAVRWMIEEFRVSLFAQTLGTRGPVSEQRIERALDQLRQVSAAS
jgi:ATP-dependent helicase HrpA